MQNYKSYYQQLNTLFQQENRNVDQGNLSVLRVKFKSDISIASVPKGVMTGDLYYHELIDSKVPENDEFEYPVILPSGNREFKNGILLLHGLNEKSWDKYLVWAAELATRLDRPVILFPIAYHMSRAPKSWSNPRLMGGIVKARNAKGTKEEATFANVALSTRLSAHPEQFVYSGVQSYYDVEKLIMQIRDGNHSLFSNNAHIDVFAYSIGAFLAEILFLSNPQGLFTHSKLFLFAGGPTFDSMVGTSRYIMDLTAFKQLLSLRRKKILKPLYAHLEQMQLPGFEQMWKGFYAMIYKRKGRKIRKEWLENRGGNLYAVALKNDKVMPVKVIVDILKGRKKQLAPRVDIIDFPYDYTHENPFPLNDDKILTLVDRSFSVVMDKAVRFYEQGMPVYNEVLKSEKKTQVLWAKG